MKKDLKNIKDEEQIKETTIKKQTPEKKYRTSRLKKSEVNSNVNIAVDDKESINSLLDSNINDQLNIDNKLAEKIKNNTSNTTSYVSEINNANNQLDEEKSENTHEKQTTMNTSNETQQSQPNESKTFNYQNNIKEFISIPDLQKSTSNTLKKTLIDLGVPQQATGSSLRSNLIMNILKHKIEQSNNYIDIYCEGVLEIFQDGYGFLRSQYNDYKISPEDIYVSSTMIKKFGLRKGDTIFGISRSPRSKERHFSLTSITKINFKDTKESLDRIVFENEIPEYPKERIWFETNTSNTCGRMLDLVSPMGKGQRALISAPPRCGKTMLMKTMAQAIKANHPDSYVIILLIDERPEEVTDMKRSVPNAEIIASTFDEEPERQIQLAELVCHKAKRLCEASIDVVIFVDSITRLTRGYNALQTGGGRSLSGGVDPNALYKSKKLFGIARNLQDAGSISIIASCLIQTSSKLDEVVHEEFKGRGNCDIYLSAQLANRRIFPAFDIEKSGTRQEESLLHEDEMTRHVKLRRELANYTSVEQTSLLLNRIKDTQNNIELLMSL